MSPFSNKKQQQEPLTAFFGGAKHRHVVQSTKKRAKDGSHFGTCPLCHAHFPFHQLNRHAADCNGSNDSAAKIKKKQQTLLQNNAKVDNSARRASLDITAPSSLLVAEPDRKKSKMSSTTLKFRHHPLVDGKAPTCEPIPGLYLYEEFITEEEEQQILSELDGNDIEFASEFLPWKTANFNGPHLAKRWGVHCNLRERKVGAAEHPLPNFVRHILLPKLQSLKPMNGCIPNEANAIDYRRKQGHYLAAHVDDRQLSKEPIANLSLAGDCKMTFRNVAIHRNTAVPVQKVLLKRRCLQVLTGKARYDFSHGIDFNDFLSDRRVSVTMRESPSTDRKNDGPSVAQLWWKNAKPSIKLVRPCEEWIVPVREPIPGLFVFPDFITEEEESVILKEIDDDSIQLWSSARHTGHNRQKHWGVDHDLWSQNLRPPKYELPSFMHTVLIPRLQRLKCMQGCTPNYVNAVDYHRALEHSLGAHVDDRKKYKEPIANLSLAGDCYMTFGNIQLHRNLAVREERVLLPRRCLQVMTGKARYDFSHCIETEQLLSARRVSVTMRETSFRK